MSILETAGIQNLPSYNLRFIDDNCPIHRAKIVKEWKTENGVGQVYWPANSPDLNKLENAWSYVKKQLQTMQMPFEKLEETSCSIWANVPGIYPKIVSVHANSLLKIDEYVVLYLVLWCIL